MYEDRRSNRLMTAIVVLLVLVLLSLFLLIGVVVASELQPRQPEGTLPQSSQAVPEEPQQPEESEEPELPAESSEEEESSSGQEIVPVQPQPQPAVKPQSSSSSSEKKEDSSKEDSSEYPDKTYKKGGYYDSRQTLGKVMIKNEEITLENKTIKGSLTIAKDTEGTIELVDCVVEGPLYIRGGETIILTDTRVAEIIVKESYGQEVTIIADEESRSGKVTAYTAVVLDESSLSSNKNGFSELKVASGDPTVSVTLVDTLLTRATVDEEALLFIDGGSSIRRLRVNEPTVIDGTGEIELLTIASDEIYSYIIPDDEEKVSKRYDDVIYLEHTIALASPTDLAVNYNGSVFRLSWNAADANATGYEVEMTAEGVAISKTLTETTLDLNDEFIGKATTIKVRATTTKEGYSASEWATLTYTPTQVGDITGFEVKSVAGNKVELVWNAAANAESYTLTYQKNTDTPVKQAGITGISHTFESFTFADIDTYSFTITPIGAANTKPAATPNATTSFAVKQLTAPDVTGSYADKKITFSWNAVNNAAGYVVDDSDTVTTQLTAVVEAANVGTYTARVVAKGGYNQTDKILYLDSTERTATFVVANTPDIVGMTKSITYNADSATVKFVWTKVEGTSYTVTANGIHGTYDPLAPSYTVAGILPGSSTQITVTAQKGAEEGIYYLPSGEATTNAYAVKAHPDTTGVTLNTPEGLGTGIKATGLTLDSHYTYTLTATVGGVSKSVTYVGEAVTFSTLLADGAAMPDAYTISLTAADTEPSDNNIYLGKTVAVLTVPATP